MIRYHRKNPTLSHLGARLLQQGLFVKMYPTTAPVSALLSHYPPTKSAAFETLKFPLLPWSHLLRCASLSFFLHCFRSWSTHENKTSEVYEALSSSIKEFVEKFCQSSTANRRGITKLLFQQINANKTDTNLSNFVMNIVGFILVTYRTRNANL